MSNRVVVIGIAAAALVGTGCASKKYVDEQLSGRLSPVDERLAEAEKDRQANANRIGALEDEVGKDISRVEELARTAGTDAAAAGTEAAEALGLAQDSWDKANEEPEPFKYKLLTAETVYFDFNSRELGQDAQSVLDRMVAQLEGFEDFFFEVRGFTDSSGADQYNLELSQDRADAVVRYLTARHKVPLLRTRVLGYGSDSPVGDNKTKEGRTHNRRVELNLLVNELEKQEGSEDGSSTALLRSTGQ